MRYMLNEDIQKLMIPERHKPVCGEEECDVTAFQEIDTCVPVTIEPFVVLGEVEVECLGDPCITPVSCHQWNRNGTCKLTVTQKLCVSVPIIYGAKASAGSTSVLCKDASDKGCHRCVHHENDNGDYESQIYINK